jgi:IS30 family transposase
MGERVEPQQIAQLLPVDVPDDASMRISHEAIYQALYVQGRGALRREPAACLRTGRALRVPRARSKRGKGFLSDEVMISERPAEVDYRAVPGHWARRPHPRPAQLRDRHPGRAHHPVYDAAAPAAHARPTVRRE